METYETSDLSLASFLYLTQGLEGMNTENLNSIQFVFENTPELKENERLYWSGKALVDPSRHFQAIRDLKTKLHKMKNT